MGIEVHTWTGSDLAKEIPRFEAYVLAGVARPRLASGVSNDLGHEDDDTPHSPLTNRTSLALSRHPSWLPVLQLGLGHDPFCLEAREGETTRGLLPLAYVRSLLFDRFLVSLPYLNSGGVMADDPAVAPMLIDRAVRLADELKVRYLELRHEEPIAHPALTGQMTDKIHMRLALPANSQELWNHLPSKVRNQIRKGQKVNLFIDWGGHELLPEFYAVFSESMRDLGTPGYGLDFFRSILNQFPDRAELAVVRHGPVAVAVALMLHGWGVSEVPSASSLRHYRASNANMLLYWLLLERAVKRGNQVFDFGRSTKDSNTYRFKKQWGARPEPAVWQYYVRRGSVGDLRPENPKYQRLSHLWQYLPLRVTRWIGPWIVRGIP